MDDLDKILSDVYREEEVDHDEDWWCMECEHGPMTEKELKCSRCGIKRKNFVANEDEITGWEDEDIESEVEEIY